MRGPHAAGAPEAAAAARPLGMRRTAWWSRGVSAPGVSIMAGEAGSGADLE